MLEGLVTHQASQSSTAFCYSIGKTRVKGAVEILEDEIAPDSPRCEFAEIAKREVERLDNLIGDFLRFARPAQPSTAPADLTEIVRSTAAFIGSRAAAQNVQIELQLASHLPLIHVDAEQIKQVLLNLTINALQAMPHGGQMKLRTALDKETAAVEVEDTGGGVSESVAGRIFDPFFTTKEKGVGLGLSIAYKIALQHDGNLSLVNGKQGAIFRLSLPRKD